MKIESIHPEIVTAKLNRRERRVLSHEVRDIARELPKFQGPDAEADYLNHLDERAKMLGPRLSHITHFLSDMSTHRGPKVAIFRLGVDTVRDEEIGPTLMRHPNRGETQNLFPPDSYRGLLGAMAQWYGYGYTTQQNGVIHNNVAPLESARGQSGVSTGTGDLGLHSEDASFNLRRGPKGEGPDISPDFLTLHFFRNPGKPEGVPTVISMPNWNGFDMRIRERLHEEWYTTQTSPLQGGSDHNPEEPVSVLYGPTDEPWIRFNANGLNLDQYDPYQAEALGYLNTHLQENQLNVSAKRGDIVIIDNRRVLHGRAPYDPSKMPKYDGTDRWQRREVYSRDSKRIQNFERYPRVVDPSRIRSNVR